MKTAFLIFLMSLQAHAADGLRCESLFAPAKPIQARLDQALERLGYFWIELTHESDVAKKNILRDEFELKMAEFAIANQQSLEAIRPQFQHTIEKIRDQVKQTQTDERLHERDEQIRRELEAQALDELNIWRGFLKIKPFDTNAVGSIAVTGDGSKLIVSSENLGPKRKQTKVFDLKTLTAFDLEIPVSVPSNQRPISADGSTLFVNMGENNFKLIDLRTMTERPVPQLPIRKGRAMTKAALSADGTFLFYSTKGKTSTNVTVHVYDLKNNKALPTPWYDLPSFYELSISADGSKIFGNRGPLGISSMPLLWGFDLKKQTEIQFPINFDSASHVHAVLDDKNQSLNIVVSHTSFMHVLDLNTNQSRELKLPFPVTDLKTIPGTPWMILTSEDRVSIIDPTTGVYTPVIVGTANPLILFNHPRAAITPDFKHFFVAFGESYQMRDTEMIDTFLDPAKAGNILELISAGDGSKFVGLNQKRELVIWFRNPAETRNFPGAEIQLREPQ